MGIDPIGKGAGPHPPVASPDAARVSTSDRAFDLGGAGSTEHVARVESPSGPLEQLSAGIINLDGYLDAKVNEATAHLQILPSEELEAVRSALRDRLAADPTLVDLVRQATGALPRPPDE